MKHEQYSPRSQQNVMKNTTKRDNIANTVSKTLERRPSIKELQERNILEDQSIAPSLQASAKSFSKAHTMDQLSHKLENRPEKDELAQNNILKEPNVAPCVQAAAHDLKMSKISDNISSHLERRSSFDKLKTGDIVRGKKSK